MVAGLIDLAGLVSALSQVGMVERIGGGEAVSELIAGANNSRQEWIRTLQIVVLFVTAPVFLTWFYRIYRRASATGQPIRYSAGWAVGGWFVPLVNWVLPYQVARDVWSAFSPGPADRRPAALVSWWWGAFLVSNVLARMGGSMTRNATSVDALLRANRFTGLAYALSAAAALLAIRLVLRLTERATRPMVTHSPSTPATDLPAARYLTPDPEVLMPAWKRPALIGSIVVVAYETIGALASRSLGFEYALLAIGSILIYAWVGFQVVRGGGTMVNALVGSLVVGLVEVTIAWAITWQIGPGRPEADDPQGLTYILTGAATALTVAALFGLLGGRLARGRMPRPA